MMFAPLGDSAVVVTLGDAIDESTLVRVRSLTAQLERAALPGIVDVVPAYSTVTVFYDVATPAYGEEPPFEYLSRVIAEHVAKVEHVWPDLVERKLTGGGPTEVEIPVCYGGEFGPDLSDVARHCGLTASEVIALHTEPTYLVYAVGFTPGFPYLGGLSKKLATPRRAGPRTNVAAGSVGIGGMQTGIYPRSTPGGWQLIGRTPVLLFDVAAKPPARLRVGDHVRFRSITPEEFATWK